MLTGSRGDRSHGFCRRVYIGVYPKKLPVVFCIVTNQLWSLFYYKILEIMEQFITQDRLLGIGLINELPMKSNAALFLNSLYERLRRFTCSPGTVMRIPLPPHPQSLKIEPLQKILTLGYSHPDLKWYFSLY